MSTNTGRLAGKVAIITGASKGTGVVMGKQFADAGAKVLMVARNEDAVKEAAAAAAGHGAIGMRADVTNEADVAAMVDRAHQRMGPGRHPAQQCRHSRQRSARLGTDAGELE